MMCEIYGRAGGICKGKGGSMHIADLDQGMLGANGIIGAGAPIACGAALTAKAKGTGGVAVAFIGDGGINQGTTAESLNLARVWQLPVVFVIEDNGYGEAMASEWAVSGSVVKRAGGYGVPAVEVDGVDLFAVHATAGEAVARARGGGGPTLIHCKLSRFYGHYEGEAQSYRGPGEVERLRRERDPLTVFQRRVTEAALLDAEALAAVDSEVAALIDEAVATAKSAPPPAEESLLEDVYVSY
jgi:pyruvate dehydrogenase E1 component alpha subunit